MSGKTSRNKGARGERMLAWALTEIGLPSSRGGRAGCRDEDIEHPIEGVHIECKYQAKPSIMQAMVQAQRDAGDKVPIVISRKVLPIGSKSEPWLVTVRLDDLHQLATAVSDAHQPGALPI